ncbi:MULTISPECIES: glycoside hydrolase family 3 C-terminal domain-containing protein [unclassified Leeuwenhoekiella]|uniref:glycoside hydrolase family 3 C-terminal domain-containing protein n=1 Tax=unclassified Leeuwenhoekiella TaxID=2615029 RepID=UPI0025C36F27|nr:MULTISPECIES: glycoside hydrolase family 3 C-terminal domain-containing protein [unclassified Leeuwenhoekiella]
MNKLFYYPIVFFAASLLMSSCNTEQKESSQTIEKMQYADPEFPFYDTSLSVDERVADLISRLSLEEKAAQMMNSTPAIERLGIPPYDYWNEALHGVGRASAATVFPQAIGIGATFDADLAYRISNAISDEARALYNATSEKGLYNRYNGLSFWTPNINIFRDPRWGRGQETYGEDPYLMSLIGVAFVKGLQGDDPDHLKTAACAKHFAVHSGPEQLRHEFNATASLKDMYETYLPAFEALVNENVEAVMCAYNSTNGEPCCTNKYLLDEVLRKNWNFDGHILSDCAALVDLYVAKGQGGHGTAPSKAGAAAMAVKSGVSLNCGDTYSALPEAVQQGLITEAEIDEQLALLLKTRFKLGLFDPRGSNKYDSLSLDVVNNDEHRALARESAQKSIVLLKNDGILPLKKDLPKYFLTGPNATSTEVLLGNYYGVNSNMVTILEGISAAISPTSQLQYRQGAMLNKDSRNPINYATGNAANSDVTLVVLGLSSTLQGEEGDSIDSDTAGDRLDYGLPPNQIQYLEDLRAMADRNPEDRKPLIAIVTGGSPVDLSKVQELADAVLYVWYPGEEGGTAIADVLFGDVSPSGRLPITFPKSLDQLPAYDDYSMEGRTYKYMNEEPMYPFGFGLSYTQFEYSDATLDKTELSAEESVSLEVTVKNTGKVKSDEVVQVYISDLEASVRVPNSQFINTRRVTLEPGASEKVTFEIKPESFQVVQEDGSKIIEPGKFRLYVGGSSPMTRSAELGASKMAEVEFAVN